MKYRKIGFVAIAVTLWTQSAVAQRRDNPDAASARSEFVRGTELVESAQWAEALAAFERAAALHPHAVTTFNIAACERAMGRYARAKLTFERALAEHEAAGGAQLSPGLLLETRGYIGEIERLLGRVEVTLAPSSASVAVDGRPLQRLSAGGDAATWVAGVRAPGPGEAAPAKRFIVLVDPGHHVFVVSRKGFTDAVIQRSVPPGAKVDLDLSLDRLPATLRIESNETGALVTVNDRDVGPAPVDVSRPAGRYQVSVRKGGYDPYDTTVVVDAGELLRMRAPLKPEKPSITRRWWFWTAAGVVVTGTALATYFAVRPDPTRPEVSGGSLGWKVPVGR